MRPFGGRWKRGGGHGAQFFYYFFDSWLCSIHALYNHFCIIKPSGFTASDKVVNARLFIAIFVDTTVGQHLANGVCGDIGEQFGSGGRTELVVNHLHQFAFAC